MPLKVFIAVCMLSGISLSAQDMGIASASIEAQATVVPSIGFTSDSDSPSHADFLVWGRKSSNLQVSIVKSTGGVSEEEPVFLASLFVPYATFSDPRVRREISHLQADGSSAVVVTVVDIAD